MAGNPLVGLKYLGGKSSAGTGIGAWVASLLPDLPGHVEPCGGMLGVLLQRPPRPVEIVNDLDSDICNWWAVVRDQPQPLAERLWATPWSRETYEQAWDLLQTGDGTPLERAWATSVVLDQGSGHTLGLWNRRTSWGSALGQSPPATPLRQPAMVLALAERLRNVQLENCEASRLIERVSSNAETLIYLDPPYAGGVHPHYDYRATFDPEPVLELLTSPDLQAAVAVSGYPNDTWEQLSQTHGWHRHTRDTKTNVSALSHKGADRVEVLWTSYEPPTYQARLW